MEKEIALTRDELLALLDDLGGYGVDLQAVDDDTLVAVVNNKINLAVDMAKIDVVLAKPLPMSWRGRLTSRKIELENAARAVRDAAAGRQPPRGNMVITVPDGIGTTHYYGKDRVVCSRIEGGRTVLDLHPQEFRSLLNDRHHGLRWQESNPEAVRQLAETSR